MKTTNVKFAITVGGEIYGARGSSLYLMTSTRDVTTCRHFKTHLSQISLVSASASENGASCQQRYLSVIRRRVVVATAMFTGRAGAGSTEARRAGAKAERGSRLGGSDCRAGAEARIEGQSRACGGSGM